MKCASYTRTVSCLRESEIPSDIISQQNKSVQAFIKENGWSLVKKYSDRKKDELEESAFLEMRQDAIGRQFDCLVMDSMFRCGKNTNVAAELFRNVFLPAGIAFAVVEDHFCSNEVSTDEAVAYLEEKVKEYRSYTVNKDMQKYTETKKFPKYGYRYRETGMELEIDPKAAENVKKIFQLVCAGHSFRETAEIMTEAGTMSSGRYIDMLWGRTVKNPHEPWKRDQIKRIIYNRLYIGEWVRTINGEKQMFSCPVIIEKKMFDQANNREDITGTLKAGRGKTPLNPFAKIIFDKDSGIPLKLVTHERLQVRVFRRSYANKDTVKYKKGNMPYEEVYGRVYSLILREKEIAEKVMWLMDTEEWQREKEKHIRRVKAAAQMVFRRMMELEEKNVCLYQKMVEGRLSREEYEYQKEQGICEFEMNDKLIQQYMEQLKEVEICFSDKNPWICLFKKIEIPSELKREDVKKWIERIEIVRFEYAEVHFKYWEWKEKFPKQWLEVEEDGTKE